MKAIVYAEYGSPDVLRCTDAQKPAPADDEVLLRVRAVSLNALDWRLLRARRMFARLGLGRRKLQDTGLCVDVAGRVEAVGRNVTAFRPGDEVFGVCQGACAEYACAREEKLALKPANVSFEDAAAVPVAAISALQGLRDVGRVRRGHRVLVDGASGGVGTFAVQIAKALGAEVTAVCSTRNVDTARSIGADLVVDYTRDDFAQSGQRYDLIIGANAHRSIFAYRRALDRNGIYVIVGGGWSQILQSMLLGPLLSLAGSKKVRFFVGRITRADLDVMKDLLAAGSVVPVIDRRYALSDAAEALLYVEEGHARGKVVITVDGRDGA